MDNKNVISSPTITPFVLLVMILGAVLILFSTPAQAEICGDANDDNLVNVGDVVYLVTYVFRGGPPPEPLCGGDVNGDGEVNVGDAVYLINWIFNGGPPPVCMSGWSLVDYEGCKTFWKAGNASDTIASDQDCLLYHYDNGKLTLKHVNAGFNCCPDEIVVDINIDGNNITITETEINGDCYCLCLFDVDIEIYFLPPGEYNIRIEEIYADPIEFTADLITEPVGGHCVTRSHYPWGMGADPSGQIVSSTGCKFMKNGDSQDPPSDQDCLNYSYSSGNLTLRHLNAGFNCCPEELLADFTFSSDTIIISENETLEGGGCDCLCLFDVTYELTGILPGEYTIIIEGMYLNGGEDPLSITVDLNQAPSGEECLQRYYYPWGFY